jgi:hypothetical protein
MGLDSAKGDDIISDLSRWRKEPSMAILSELVTTMAKVSGMDLASVALIGRQAREAGLIATTGRGPSAASMGLTDAANLLIAVNTVRHAREVARAIPLYRQLVPYERDPKGNRHALEGVGRLGEVIENLIHAAAVGAFPDSFLGKEMSVQLKDDFAQRNAGVFMKFNVTFVAAAMRIIKRIPEDSLPQYPPLDLAPVMLAFDFFPPAHRRRGVGYQFFRGPGVLGNRIEETTIGHRTFREIGQLIEPTTAERGRKIK